ncbi:MFS transporter [Bradyrhizobium sp. dw_78]|uniref:MFS transporter n=1 Tax=Bradyrhizobium sp. dw_78 TaxID=2719793 RepID=UPI001BD27082|nr:MFS transporter [Bradyrhizobium sp. dw_78]
MTITATAPVVGMERTNMNAIVFASSIGTIIEWYDFLIYATAAALVFNKAFFPTFDPLAGTLAALGSYAVGFVARPLGAALFGHFGDRLGRKSMLVLTLFVMGLSTFCIGLLPTYASVGIFAPILLILLRVVQGIGLGGEWGGASLMVLEHAPAEKRGFYTSFVQVGFPIGLVLATLVFSLVTRLSDADVAAYGWRIPFLVSIILLAIGTFVRSRVPETPVFEGLKTRDNLSANPFAEAVGKNTKPFLIAVGLKLSEVSWVYMLTVFVVVYATTKLGLSKPMMLDAVLYAALLELITLPLFGWLSDQIGRRPLFILGALFTILFAFPLFWMMESKSAAIVFTAMIIAMNLGHGLMFATESAYFPELFGPRVRYSGATFGFQLSAAIGGGFAPIVATAMAGYIGGTTGVSIMLVVLGLITLAAALAARETLGGSLTE